MMSARIAGQKLVERASPGSLCVELMVNGYKEIKAHSESAQNLTNGSFGF